MVLLGIEQITLDDRYLRRVHCYLKLQLTLRQTLRGDAVERPRRGAPGERRVVPKEGEHIGRIGDDLVMPHDVGEPRQREVPVGEPELFLDRRGAKSPLHRAAGTLLPHVRVARRGELLLGIFTMYRA